MCVGRSCFFVALACALAGTNGTKRWPTHFISLHKSLIEAVRALVRVGCADT
jgi:hypothetical protein